MGLVQRILDRRRRPADGVAALHVSPGGMPSAGVRMFGGRHDLEIVGESFCQDALWRIVGGRRTEPVRVEIHAVLLAETDNQYDPNAISVWIDGLKVGHLSREDAAVYRPGLLALNARYGAPIALAGVVVGGGIRQDGPGMLGVWLWHDPADFGLVAMVPPTPALVGELRTGLTQALLTDAADDSYDLSWLERLPSDSLASIRELRRLLEHDPDPIDRHFMFCELESRLYRSRDVFESALAEYDEACARHDAEMDGICQALLAKFGRMPVLETYRQMAIRQQKVKDWRLASWWTERGIALYGDQAARPEAVDDLRKRLAAYQAKLAVESPASAAAPQSIPATTSAAIEVLICTVCGRRFERSVVRGRKPKRCPSCV